MPGAAWASVDRQPRLSKTAPPIWRHLASLPSVPRAREYSVLWRASFADLLIMAGSSSKHFSRSWATSPRHPKYTGAQRTNLQSAMGNRFERIRFEDLRIQPRGEFRNWILYPGPHRKALYPVFRIRTQQTGSNGSGPGYSNATFEASNVGFSHVWKVRTCPDPVLLPGKSARIRLPGPGEPVRKVLGGWLNRFRQGLGPGPNRFEPARAPTSKILAGSADPLGA